MSHLDPERDDLLVSTDELRFLKVTCGLGTSEESPFHTVSPAEGPEVLVRARDALAQRGLVDPRSLRPHRELLRRALVVAQPEARVVMMRSGPEGGRRELDLYERAGACIPLAVEGEAYRLGPARALSDAVDDLLVSFSPRRSSGDFIDLVLSTTEYFAFSLLAGEAVERRSRTPAAADDPTGETELIEALSPGEGPTEGEGLSLRDARGRFEEGTPVHDILGTLPGQRPRSFSVIEEEWSQAMESLVAKELVVRSDDRYALRAFLEDLALGLAARRRVVLTRFEFGEREWAVRDTTLIEVPGSIFLMQTIENSAIRIAELDGEALARTVRSTVLPGKLSG